MPKVKVNNINLYYETHGEGDPLLLIPGLGCDSQAWLPVINGLSNRFRIIAIDNRGAGRSDVPGSPYTIRDMADDASRLLDHLSVRSTHIIGHSLGGYIAQEFAINYPERVNRLILESTAPVSSQRNNILFECFLDWRREGMDLEPWMRAWSFWLFTPQRFEDKDYIDGFIRECVEYPHPQSIKGLEGQINAISSFDARDRLGKIRAKTLVIEGKEDILILPGEVETLAKGIPGSSMLYVGGAAHLLHMEREEEFNRAVRDFLLRGERG